MHIISNLRDCQEVVIFSASSVPMDTIKLPKNFTLSRESMKETLAAFKANKSIFDMTCEVFQAATLALSAQRSAPTPNLL